MDATTERQSEHKDFAAAEKEMVKSVDQLTRAGHLLKKGLSFAQVRGGKKHLIEAVNALSTIVDAQWLDISSKRRLQSFIQSKKTMMNPSVADLKTSISNLRPRWWRT